MNSRPPMFLILAAATLTGARAEQTETTPNQGRPSLAGRWQLNVKQSEDPHEKMKEAFGGSRSGGGFRGPGGPGRGGHTGSFGGPDGAPGGFGRGGSGSSDEDRHLMRGFFEAPERLDIAQTDPEVTLVQDDGVSRRLHTDGRKDKHDSEGGTAETTTRWEGNQLLVETKTAGLKMRESYSVAPDHQQLFVTVRVESSRLRQPVSVRRVYDVVGDNPS